MLWSIIVGIIAGYVACRLTNQEGKGCFLNLLIGIVGGALGGWLFDLLDISWGGTIGEIGTAIVGSVVLLWLWNKLVKWLSCKSPWMPLPQITRTTPPNGT